ncbi:hypothetical protein [Actinokineospora enzanensis]|uniref:hypothetical protein n=1 Tax=Actinokineospora enzanensis TaxID=155975 RepID=UPI00035D1D57|nr:hypothetical protein [Actinokineospora enzanensis]
MSDLNGEDPQPATHVAFPGTWRYRNLLLRIAIIIPALTLALAVSTVVTGAVFAWATIALWTYLDVLVWRQWRQLSLADHDAAAISVLRSVGIGLGLFLLGALFILLDTLFHTR